MATTYNFTNGSISGQNRQVAHTPEEDRLFILRNIVDFSLQSLDVSASDVAKVINIPADTLVLDVFMRCITAETADAILDLGYGSDTDYWGQKLAMDTTAGLMIPTILKASATWDVGSLADGAEEAKEVTVDGAQIGDAVTVIAGIDVADIAFVGQVTAADTVTVQAINSTGGTIDLASQTITVVVDKAPLRKQPLYFASADTIDLLSAGSTDIDGAKVEVTAICLKLLDTY